MNSISPEPVNNSEPPLTTTSTQRVADHRKELKSKGVKRLEIQTTMEDRDAITKVAMAKGLSDGAAARFLLRMGIESYGSSVQDVTVESPRADPNEAAIREMFRLDNELRKREREKREAVEAANSLSMGTSKTAPKEPGAPNPSGQAVRLTYGRPVVPQSVAELIREVDENAKRIESLRNGAG